MIEIFWGGRVYQYATIDAARAAGFGIDAPAAPVQWGAHAEEEEEAAQGISGESKGSEVLQLVPERKQVDGGPHAL